MHQHADVNQLLLQLEHVVEDEMSDDEQGLTTHMIVLVMQQVEEFARVLVEEIGETIEQVAEGNDDVRLDTKVNLRLQKLEDSFEVLGAKL